MKGIILYKSHYGSTAQYARWLSEDTGLKALPLSEAEPETVKSCELIIIGSCIKVGRILASDWIKTHWSWLKDKNLILFSVSGSYANKRQQRNALEISLPDEMIVEFTYFPLPGKLDKKKLNFWDRIIVFLGSKAIRDEEAKERMEHGFDYVSRNALLPVKKAVSKLIKKVPQI